MKRIPWYFAAALLAVLGYAVLKSWKSQQGTAGTSRTQGTQVTEPVHSAYPTVFGTLPTAPTAEQLAEPPSAAEQQFRAEEHFEIF